MVFKQLSQRTESPDTVVSVPYKAFSPFISYYLGRNPLTQHQEECLHS
jgi:hypothetical protein